jgi:hypothetical protein
MVAIIGLSVKSGPSDVERIRIDGMSVWRRVAMSNPHHWAEPIRGGRGINGALRDATHFGCEMCSRRSLREMPLH